MVNFMICRGYLVNKKGRNLKYIIPTLCVSHIFNGTIFHQHFLYSADKKFSY